MKRDIVAAGDAAEELLRLRSCRAAVALIPMEAVMGLPLPWLLKDGRLRWLVPFFCGGVSGKPTALAAVLLAEGSRPLAWLSAEAPAGSWPLPEPAEGDLLRYLKELEAIQAEAENWNEAAAEVRSRALPGGAGECHRFLLRLRGGLGEGGV